MTTARQRLAAASPANVLLLLASVLGIGYVFLTPPLQAPDEFRHLRRVVQIVHGGITSGAPIPESLGRFAAVLRGDEPGPRRGSRDRAFPVARLGAAAAVPLDAGDTIDFPGDRYLPYSPVAYLPGVVSVGLGSYAGFPPLALLYLARLGLLAGGIALLYFSVRLTPTLPWLLCFVALLPTATFVRSGVSADTLTTAYAFLLFALMMRLRARTAAIGHAEICALLAVATALALCKTGYLPLTLVALALPADRFASSRRRWLSILVLIVVPAAVSALWLGLLGDWMANDGHRRADSGQQLRLMLEDPLRFLRVLEATWLAPARLWQLATTFVGRILVLSVPPVVVTASLVVVGVLSFVDRRKPSPALLERLIFAAAVVACIVAISLGLYLKTTAPGSATVRGFQGRYFYPLVPFALFALLPPRPGGWATARALPAALVILATLAANAWGIASVIAATWLGAS